MVVESIRTQSKCEAMELLGCCLESQTLIYAGIQHLDGVYTVEVTRPTGEVIDVIQREQGQTPSILSTD